MDACELTEEPAGEIDQVRALIDQFAAAGFFRFSAPFVVVAGPASVAIASADEHEFAERAGIEDLARLAEGAMETVVEADAHEGSGSRGGFGDGNEFGGAAGAGFFDEDVFAGGGGGGGDGREEVVRCGYEHGIDIGIANGFPPICKGSCAVLGGELRGARRVDIATDGDAVGRERGGALTPNQSAADNSGARCFLRDQLRIVSRFPEGTAVGRGKPTWRWGAWRPRVTL